MVKWLSPSLVFMKLCMGYNPDLNSQVYLLLLLISPGIIVLATESMSGTILLLGREPNALGREPTALGREPNALGREPTAVLIETEYIMGKPKE